MSSNVRAFSHEMNKLFKYAVETILLVPKHANLSLKDEFRAFQRWAESNKRMLDLLETKEIMSE